MTHASNQTFSKYILKIIHYLPIMQAILFKHSKVKE